MDTDLFLLSKQSARKARRPRVLLVVDVQNMQSSTIRPDYMSLARLCQAMGELVTAAAFVTDSREQAQIKFHLMLHQVGYEIVPTQPICNGNGEPKCNADILLAFWLGQQVEQRRFGKGDTVVLCTGDGDFAQIAQWLRHRGIRVVVIAFKTHTSPHLRLAANTFYAIEETQLLQYQQNIPAA